MTPINPHIQPDHHELDVIEELKLRRWAREHYVQEEHRSQDWHPVIHDEMTTRDREQHRSQPRT